MYDKNEVMRAIEYEKKVMQKQTIISLRKKIQEIVDMIGGFDVQCPYCGAIMKTTSYKTKTCVYCDRSFTIFPVNDRSRVADTEENRKKRPYIMQISYLLYMSSRR